MRSLNPRREIGESIIEGPLNFGVSRGEAMDRARELLELVGLPGSAIDRFPHQFSGGQRQRIAIARALAMDPDILVADEAVSALDVSVQAQVLELLARLQERFGLGILFITHDLGVAAQICDEVMVMQKGLVVEYGPAGEVLGNPQQDYTKALISAAPGRHWDFANFRPFSETPAAEAAPAHSS
jgi:peptide/nickel transport system ATP-binding protein